MVLAEMADRHSWIKGAELGVFQGKTYIHLLNACPALSMVGVDIWEPRPEMEALRDVGGRSYEDRDLEAMYQDVVKATAHFGDRSRLIRQTTQSAAALFPNRSFDFVFIDADHTLAGVVQDITLWAPKVALGGWVMGHDYQAIYPGVREAVDTLLGDVEKFDDSVWGVPVHETAFG
ncbi:MAG: class I SAM-dependent methyltransferase [Dehalococcoidia bacterium]